MGAQLCLTLCDPMDLWPIRLLCPWIFSARILEWLPLPSPGDLPDPGMEPASPALAGRCFTTEPPDDLLVWYMEQLMN